MPHYPKDEVKIWKDKVFKFLYNLPDEYKFEFKKMRKYRGMCFFDKKIEIDPRGPILPTIIHEILHQLDDSLSESAVLRLETKISNQLTMEEYKDLLVLISEKISFIETFEKAS